MLIQLLALLKRPWIVFLLICAVYLGIYGFLYNRAKWITPKGRVHTMENVDAFYPDVIRQGKLGAWIYTESRTTLPIPKVYTLLFFIVAGKIAALFSIDPVVMYEITKATGGLAILSATYWLVTLVVPRSYQIVALICTMVLETGPAWDSVTRASIWQWIAASPGQEIIKRHFGLSHHTWGEAIGLALVALVVTATRRISFGALLGIFFLALFGPLCSPTYFAIVVCCFLIPWIVYAVLTKSIKRILPPVFVAILGVGLAGIFTKSQFAVGEPWSSFIRVEKSWWTTDYVLTPFIQSFTLYYPISIISCIATIATWKRWPSQMRQMFLLFLSWSVLPVLLIYASALSWFPLVNGRIASDVSNIPIGILATYAFYAVSKLEYVKQIAGRILGVCFSLLVAISLFLSGVYIQRMVSDQDVAVNGKGNSFTLYADKDLWNGMMELSKVPLWSHVMVLPRVGDLLPAFVPVRVYQGDPYTRQDWLMRRGLSHQFYTGEMSEDALYALLQSNDISYVFYGPEEQYARKTKDFYPEVLDPIYVNSQVTIFKVRPLSK